MADSVVLAELCTLISGRFGPPQPHIFGGLLGGVLGSDHNVASASFDVGTVMVVTQKASVAGATGMSEFVYGRFVQDEGSSAFAMAAGQTCIPSTNANATAHMPTFTNYSEETSSSLFMNQEANNPFAVIALSVMTIGRYGWFWSGGVCPEDFVTALTSNNIHSDSSAIEGPIGSVDAADAGVIAVGLFDAGLAGSIHLSNSSTGGLYHLPMGYALKANA